MPPIEIHQKARIVLANGVELELIPGAVINDGTRRYQVKRIGRAGKDTLVLGLVRDDNVSFETMNVQDASGFMLVSNITEQCLELAKGALFFFSDRRLRATFFS